MTEIHGKIGPFHLEFMSVPVGNEGTIQVKVATGGARQPHLFDVRWKRDSQGLWLETLQSVKGFDLRVTREDGVVQYEAVERNGTRSWSGVRFLRAGETDSSTGAGPAKAGKARVRAQMPGKIVKILVKPGDHVVKDQPLIVMEAMKMENEIRALSPAIVGAVKVVVGQAIETGADLILMESS